MSEEHVLRIKFDWKHRSRRVEKMAQTSSVMYVDCSTCRRWGWSIRAKLHRLSSWSSPESSQTWTSDSGSHVMQGFPPPTLFCEHNSLKVHVLNSVWHKCHKNKQGQRKLKPPYRTAASGFVPLGTAGVCISALCLVLLICSTDQHRHLACIFYNVNLWEREQDQHPFFPLPVSGCLLSASVIAHTHALPLHAFPPLWPLSNSITTHNRTCSSCRTDAHNMKVLFVFPPPHLPEINFS